MNIRRNFDEMQDLFDRFDVTDAGRNGMTVDTMEEADAFVVTADLPGFTPADVGLTLRGEVLEIAATSETDADDTHEESGVTYVRRERASRSLRRSIRLPAEVAADAVEAELTNGVLTVRLPKLAHDEQGVSIDVE